MKIVRRFFLLMGLNLLSLLLLAYLPAILFTGDFGVLEEIINTMMNKWTE